MAGVKGRSGAKPTNPRGRDWFRRLVDEQELRWQYEKNLRAKLADGDVDAFLKTFEHGYGRPPQALAVTAAVEMPSGPLQIVVRQAEAIKIGGTDD